MVNKNINNTVYIANWDEQKTQTATETPEQGE